MSTQFWAGVRALRLKLEQQDTTTWLVCGYALYITLGWLVLLLPISQQQTTPTALDHLFTAASAVSTTGLATVATGDSYTLIGEATIALMIQLGGLGYMSVGSLIILAVSGQVSGHRERIARASISLPADFQLRGFLKVMGIYTIVVELCGAVALFPVFAAKGVENPWWFSLFHSISAFCTAGFGLHADSFEGYRDDYWLLFVITVLSYLGAIGYIVVYDAWRAISGQKAQVTLTTKVILWTSFWVGAIGTLLVVWSEPATPDHSWLSRLATAFFQVMSASTTVGFNTVPIGALSSSTVVVLMVAMLIGASPAGTGGGLRTTTVSSLWADTVSIVFRRNKVTCLGREIPEPRRRSAVAAATAYLVTLLAGVFALAFFEPGNLVDQGFECVSALGTVGLSRGITGSLGDWGKVILILLMFVGRVGPLVIGLAMFQTVPVKTDEVPTEELVV
jgi:trk system potassium uptake protein